MGLVNQFREILLGILFFLQFSIELIFGIVMQFKICYQLNGKIIVNLLLFLYYLEIKNVSYEDKMILILWIEKEVSIDVMILKEFCLKVGILYQCGLNFLVCCGVFISIEKC